MQIELQLTDAFDGLTRILQILRLSECRILRLDVTPASNGHRAILDISAPEERGLLVLNRLEGVIGTIVLRCRALESVAVAA